MDGFDRAGSLLASRISEVIGNLRVRQTHSFFVRNQAELFRREGLRGELKGALNRALSVKNASESVLHRGLMLQLYGAFERFVADVTEAVLEVARSKAGRYSDLDENLRNAHTVGSAKLLAKLHDRMINGVPFDFGALQSDMAACFADDTKYRLSASAFTALLGVCTPERVNGIFETLRLGKAFDDTLGRDPDLKVWSKKGGARETFTLAEDTLSKLVRLRNQIAHGAGDPDVLDTEVEEVGSFLSALGKALLAKARKASK
jgi:hypothetical protein